MRLGLALGTYLVLAGAAWLTLSDLRFRLATLLVLGAIAAKTWLHWQRERVEGAGSDSAAEGEEIKPM